MIMKRLKFILVYCYLIVSLTACSQDDPSISSIKEYESCCGAEAVEHSFVSGQYLFVPNSFTPNKDGINDLWHPFFSNGLDKIQAIFIYTLEDSTLIHQMYEYSLYPSGTYGWDGTKSRNGNNLGDNSMHKGGFWYEIYFNEPVNFGAEENSFKGKACSIICDSDAAYFKDKDGCFFPIQVDINGKLDKGIKANEDACFGK
jgi:hypothetical protein